MCDGSGPGFAAITGSTGWTRPLPVMPTRHCGSGGTYPEQVIFAKGHGTQNDFVVLADLDAALTLTPAVVAALCDRRRGLGADGVLRVTTAGAALAAGVLRSAARRRERRRLVHGLPQRRRVDRADVRQRRAGVRPLPAGQRAGDAATSSSSARWPARGPSSCTASTRPTPTSASTWARPTCSGPGRPIVGGRTFNGLGGRRRQPAPGVRRPRADASTRWRRWTSRRR